MTVRMGAAFSAARAPEAVHNSHPAMMPVTARRIISNPSSNARPELSRSLDLFDKDGFELHQAGRPSPFTLFVPGAVVLKCDPARLRHVRNRGARNDRDPVQHNLDRLALHGNLEVIPFADRLVGAVPGRRGGT